MMTPTYLCCICQAVGKSRRGCIREGHAIPTCAEHFATSYWRARKQAKEPEPFVLPPEIEYGAKDALLRAAAK